MDWAGQNLTVVSNEQGTKAWHEWRGKGIGSSDAPVLLGVSPWKDIHKLYLEKTGQVEQFKGNFATERGNRLEPVARELYNTKYHARMEPGIAEGKKHAFMRASFDGIDYELQRLIEIKCPGKPDHQTACEGKVPTKYMPQLQWLMMITELDELDYVSFDGEKDLVVIRVTPDKEMQSELEKKALWFWDLVQTKTPPPNAPTPAVDVSDDNKLVEMLEKSEALKKEIDALTMSYEMIRDAIKARVTTNSFCGPFSIKWSDRKGAVNYDKIPQLEGVNLEAYRKPSTKVMTVTRLK